MITNIQEFLLTIFTNSEPKVKQRLCSSSIYDVLHTNCVLGTWPLSLFTLICFILIIIPNLQINKSSLREVK